MIQSNKIFLIGFMGSGKSTLGKKLAKKLRIPFFDLDVEIERGEGISITEVFEKKGETYFREREQLMLKEITQHHSEFVMALGGGTPCFHDNMDYINKNGTSVYLKYNSGILHSRLINAKTERPLVKNKTDEQLKLFIDEKLAEREIFYHQAKLVMEGNNLKPEDLIKELS